MRGCGSTGDAGSALLPPSSSESPEPSVWAWVEGAPTNAWSWRNGIHSIRAATGSFTSPSRTITIHNDILIRCYYHAASMMDV
jgi:hypothetical protein